ASGDISGLNFQSSGDQITIQIQADGSVSCQSSSNISSIDLTVSCATCINPSASFEVVEDCINGPQFYVDVDVTSLGDATDLEILDNQGNSETASETGIYTFGPYINGTLVDFTVENNQDSNCVISETNLTQDVCINNYVDCSVGPVDTNFCYDSGETTEFIYTSTDGTNLNLVINSGQVENKFDEFIVLDSDG
ncbi:hypothetical protein J9332_36255, partial [Aquimarina celericrescens]|nr:hypothetical protein [Aquimarina celericrescens]